MIRVSFLFLVPHSRAPYFLHIVAFGQETEAIPRQAIWSLALLELPRSVCCNMNVCLGFWRPKAEGKFILLGGVHLGELHMWHVFDSLGLGKERGANTFLLPALLAKKKQTWPVVMSGATRVPADAKPGELKLARG